MAQPPGEANIKAKLTEPQVYDIRRRWRDGESQNELAEEYHVSRMAIFKIVHWQTWRHLPDEG